MAKKKQRVLYAFTNPAKFAALAKKDRNTVYFVYDTVTTEDGKVVPGEYGTIYKGSTRIGSALASDIVFSEDLEVHLPLDNTSADSIVYTIKAGTSLKDFAKEAIVYAASLNEELKRELYGTGTSENPGSIFTTIERELNFDDENKGSIASAIDSRLAKATSEGVNAETAERDGFTGFNITTKEYVDNNFLSKEMLGKIEELTKILTPETIDIIIKAATDIQNILVDYYTKTEVDKKFADTDLKIAGVDKVKVFDSSTEFPEVGDANTLYIDDNENIMYRWALTEEGSTDRDYTEISGAGGGGSSATIETHIYVKGGKLNATIAKNTSYDAYFVFSSAYTYLKYNKKTGKFEKIQQQTGSTGTAKYFLDGTQIGSGPVTQANYHDDDDSKNVYNKFTIPAAKFTGSDHTLKISCTDNEGNTAVNEIKISVVSVSIVSSYESVPTPVTEDISIPVTVSSSNEIKIYYKVDNEDDKIFKTLPASASAYEAVIVPHLDAEGAPRSHGYHTIKVWATTHIVESDATISTEVLSYNVIWYDVNNETPIVSTIMKGTPNAEGNYEITQYEYVTLEYQIYPKGTVNLIVADSTGKETIVNTLDVTTASKTWTYTFDEYGTFSMYIKVASGSTEITSTKYTVVVAKSEYAMEPTPGAVVFFTAKNRSNEENPDTRGLWKSEVGDYTAVFDSFQWNEVSGWHKETGSDTCSLRVGGGAKVRIPYYPFKNDLRQNGQVIEFEFKTSALSNSETTLMSCFSDKDNSGIIIKANAAEFYSLEFAGDKAIKVPFKENEKIRISFVITPFAQDDKGRGIDDPSAFVNVLDTNSKKYTRINSIEQGWWRFVKIYINGILSAVEMYSSSFIQNSPQYITIGSNEATIDIYSIRAYEKVLYNKAIVDNMIADTQDASEKLRLFKRNNILTEDGTDVDYVTLMRKVPCLFVTCESTASQIGYRNDEHILPMSKKDKRGFTVMFNADNLDDEAKEFYNFCTSFIAYNVQMQVQGTSSQYYPRRNWKLKFKTNKKFNPDVDAQVQTAKPTYLYTDNINAVLGQKDNYSKDYVLKDYDKLNPGHAYTSLDTITSMAAKTYCLKADFAESSGVHNTGMARFVDYVLKTLGGKYLTPAQYAQWVKNGTGIEGMKHVSTRTTVDGYPIAMFWRPTYEDDYSFYGKFNFNVDKAAENTFGFIDSIEGETNPNTGLPFIQFNEDWYDAATPEQRFEYEMPVECFEFLNNTDDLSKFKNVKDTTFTELEAESESGGTRKPNWLNVFEVRHPDNDTLNDIDFKTGKVPTHWKKFCTWMSSTDRAGYHNYDVDGTKYPIAYEWSDTSDELFNGASDVDTLTTYEGNKAQFLADPAVDTSLKYILYPEDSSDPDYGHVMEYSNGAWQDTGAYKSNDAVDIMKVYYISKKDDVNYGKIYKYSIKDSRWNAVEGITIEDYKLDTPVKYGQTTYTYDNADYRLAKFANELPLHMNVNMTCAYYVLTEFFAMVDQRAKNMMFASWGYEPGKDKVKAANAFSSVEEAEKAGYKPVYEYGDFSSTISASAYSRILSAPETEKTTIAGTVATNVCFNEIDANSAQKAVELYNPTDTEVNLNGWTLKKGAALNNVENYQSLTFDNAAVIAAKGFFKVVFQKSATAPNVFPGGISAKNGFALRLYNATGELIDELDNGAVTKDSPVQEPGKPPVVSIPQAYVNFDTTKGYAVLCRATDGGDLWVRSSTSTIGSANIVTEPVVVPTGPETTKLVSYATYPTEVEGFSGMCWKDDDKTGFYAVGDKGKIYELDLTGKIVSTVFDNSAKDKLAVIDYEGITRATDGSIYVSTEDSATEQAGETFPGCIVRFSENFSKYEIVATIDNITTVKNQGYEGIAYYKEDIFFVANQSNPAKVFQYSLSNGIVADSDILTNADTDVTEIADLFYDSVNDKLWILDSKTGRLARVNVSDKKFEQLYSVPAKTGEVAKENPEAFTIDVEHNMLWIGCDNVANKYLYKVSLTNAPLDGKTVVINEVDPYSKRWELYNATTSPINLNGYSMTKDDKEAERYTFGDIQIDAKGFVVLQQDETGATGPVFGLSATKGFDYKLFNADGQLIDELDNKTSVTKIPDGMTYGRATDGEDKFILFRQHGTIGATNNTGIMNAGIYINEVDTNGNDIGKRFEIYNDNDTEYDLTGCTFIKDTTEWTVVPTAVGENLGLPTASIPGKGHLVVQCNNTKAASATEKSPASDITKWPTFGISGNNGFKLAIKNAEGLYLDVVDNSKTLPTFVTIGTGKTWGRATDGVEHDFRIFNTPTLGTANANGTKYNPTVAANGVVINEILPDADTVELYNSTDAEVDLSTYSIGKDGDASNVWTLPAGAKIASHGFYTVKCKQYGSNGPAFGISGTAGFLLCLANGAVTVDAVDNRADSETFTTIGVGYSYGRKEDGGAEWTIFSTPSIGETNANGKEYVPITVDPGTPITDRVVINEINGDSKAIELYNPTDSPVVLGGAYGLFKEDHDPYSATDWYEFNAGDTIPAKGYFIVTASKTAGQPQFGIALKPGKVFHLHLRKFTAKPDLTSRETLFNSTTAVDDIDNLTNPVNTPDGSFMSYGRINDGTSNLTLFEAPGTSPVELGAHEASESAKFSNNNGVPHASEDKPSENTYRRVAYWVPIDCEYIYYPIFYDNDTVMSLDNEGHIKFEPNVESTDSVGTGYAFNGTESVLWLNLKDAFTDTIINIYDEMRKTALTEENCIKFFNTEHSDKWAEALYNVDAQFKYIDPATKGYIDFAYVDPDTGKQGANRRDATYLYEAQGSRVEHRKWWLANRFIYMDSRYNTGTYKNNYVTMRIYTPRVYDPIVEPNSTFRLVPYSDMYLRIRFGSVDAVVRAEKNKVYNVVPPPIAFNDTETIIYGASSILSFGDMSDKYARTAQLDNATKVTEIKFGEAAPYYNKNLTEFAIGANNNVLKTIDVRGCNELSAIRSLNAITSLQTFKAVGTKMSTVEFSTKGANLTEIEYPNTLTQVKLINMPYIANSGVKILDYSKIAQLWIEACPNLNTWTLFNTIITSTNSSLSSARITDINWNINTSAAFDSWKKLLSIKGMTDQGYVNLNIPYLTGTVNLGQNVVVSTGYKDNVEKMFKNIGCDLTVNVTTTSDLTNFAIVGETDIATDEEYTYTISYSPDDYIKDEQKGVVWSVPKEFTVVKQSDESITIMFKGSTSGFTPYMLTATSKFKPELRKDLQVLPMATLSQILIYDANGKEISDGQEIIADEKSSVVFNIKFVPEKTKDKDVRFVFTNDENAFSGHEYDPTTQQLVIHTKDVDTNTSAYFRVESVTVADVRSVSPKVTVKNVVSRILTVQDANGNKLAFSASAKYTNPITGIVSTDPIYSETGEYAFAANSKFGVEDIELTNIKASVANSKYYNNVGKFVFNKIDAEYLTEDVRESITFYEPVEYTINLWHDNTAIEDASLAVYSLQNQSEYSLVDGVYNNVISKSVQSAGKDLCQVKIKLLANTKHDIRVTEVTKTGEAVVTGKIYDMLETTITTGITDATVNLYMNKDYLGNMDSYAATKLHMTVKTGKTLTTLRLFVKTAGEITIDWGDDSTTVIDGQKATGANLEDHSFNKEVRITHAYIKPETEYDIWVHENTANIKWFHVMQMADKDMGPCFYQGSNSSTLPLKWQANIGGLVAYQSIGEATFESIPTFKIADVNSKQYTTLASVGYLYNKFTEMTNADELFMNTKLEQIPATSIFKNNKKITSFTRTFKNCNLTSIANAFFANNKKAVKFEETFADCHNLTTIHTAETSQLIYADDPASMLSLYWMFKNCDKLTDAVPALWKTFYGYSRLRSSLSYVGCTAAANYSTIPTDWGGEGDIYYESEPKLLEYFQTQNGEGYFEFGDIILSNNMRYELEVTTHTRWYEGMPILSGGYALDPSDVDTIQNAIDFVDGGSDNGGRYENGMYSLRCRVGSSVSDSFLQTTLKPNDPNTTYPSAASTNGIFIANYTDKCPFVVSDDGKVTTTREARIVIDISKTLSGVATMTCLTDTTLNSAKTYIQNWSNDSTLNNVTTDREESKVWNLPMRLFASYDNVHQDEDNVAGYHVPKMNGRNFAQEKFHSLKIYKSCTASGLGSSYDRDPEEDLIHEIVPAYGMINDTVVPFMYDKLGNGGKGKIYAYTCAHGDDGILTNLYGRPMTGTAYCRFVPKTK